MIWALGIVKPIFKTYILYIGGGGGGGGGARTRYIPLVIGLYTNIISVT